jgi:hypothetical protein
MITLEQILKMFVFNGIVALAIMSVAFLAAFGVVGGNDLITYSATGTLQPTAHVYNPLENMGTAMIIVLLNCSVAGLLLFIFCVWVIGNCLLFNVEFESAVAALPKIKRSALAAYRAYKYMRKQP